jgi:hypothetical protein
MVVARGEILRKERGRFLRRLHHHFTERTGYFGPDVIAPVAPARSFRHAQDSAFKPQEPHGCVGVLGLAALLTNESFRRVKLSSNRSRFAMQQSVRFFLMPFQTTRLAKDTGTQSVFSATCPVCYPHGAARAVQIPKKN